MDFQKLHIECDKKSLSVFATVVGTYEMALASSLKIPQDKVTEVQERYPHNYELQMLRFFELWKEIHGSGATYAALATGFLSINRKSIAELIVEYAKNIIELKERCEQLEERLKKRSRDNSKVHVLVVGRGATGKSSLANALLGEDVCPTGTQPEGITQGLMKSAFKYGTSNIKITVYDSRGLFDGKEGTKENLLCAIRRARPGCDYDAIIVCMKSTDRFTNENKKVFQVVNEMFPGVWSKVHVALTHTDAIIRPL